VLAIEPVRSTLEDVFMASLDRGGREPGASGRIGSQAIGSERA
jgi:hypothetical protein